jgi:multidrug efflux pump subunit AcrA (membrane-fusion protein)
MKDFTRVAQLSAEEAFRMLLKKQNDDESFLWRRFETELTKRTNELLERHRGEMTALEKEKSALELRLTEIRSNQETLLANTKESERLEAEKGLRHEILTLEGQIKDLQAEQRISEQKRLLEVDQVKAELENRLQTERAKTADLTRNVQDYLLEISKLRDANNGLQAEMSKVVRIGRREEVDFAEEVRSWPCIWISEKLKRHGDYILAFRDPSGSPAEPGMVVDNKDKDSVTEADIEKLVRDAKEQRKPVAILLAREEDQLRQLDKDCRWCPKDDVWILRTTRQWLARDLDILRPVLERMRTEGSDFLEKKCCSG